jgi:hypothetical protein
MLKHKIKKIHFTELCLRWKEHLNQMAMRLKVIHQRNYLAIDELPKYEPGRVPNGGLTAWLQVAGAFLMAFNSW